MKKLYNGIQFFLAPQEQYPVKSGWRHASIKYFLKKMEEGSADTGTENVYTECAIYIIKISEFNCYLE